MSQRLRQRRQEQQVGSSSPPRTRTRRGSRKHEPETASDGQREQKAEAEESLMEAEQAAEAEYFSMEQEQAPEAEDAPVEAQSAEAEAPAAAEDQGPPARRGGRQSRISAIHTRVLQRPAQLHAGEHGPQSPRHQAEGQEQGQADEQPEDAQERLLPAELTGPPVLEDLGPEAAR